MVNKKRENLNLRTLDVWISQFFGNIRNALTRYYLGTSLT